MELPDGTMVMPIDDEESDTNSNIETPNKSAWNPSLSNGNPANRDLVNPILEENDDEKDSTSFHQVA